MKKLTIIMPFLNEKDDPIKTIKSIYATASSKVFKIITIDDNSTTKTKGFENFEDVVYIRNEKRLGVGASRNKGVYLADTPYILIIDGHMQFLNDNWCNELIKALEKEPKTIFCTSSQGFNIENIAKKRFYYGANLVLYDFDRNKDKEKIYSRKIIEPKWFTKEIKPKFKKSVEIPCVLGANYGFSTKWFKKLKGFEGLQMWGSSEPFISLKSWLAGGKCKLLPNICIRHKYRERAPYFTESFYMYYNKIFLASTIFPQSLSTNLIRFLGYNRHILKARRYIALNYEEIQHYRKYYKSIFKKSIYNICDKFNIDYNWPKSIPK